MTLQDVIDAIRECEADCRCGNVAVEEVVTRLREVFGEDAERTTVAELRAALVRAGHSRLCGIILGDEARCGECRKGREEQR